MEKKQKNNEKNIRFWKNFLREREEIYNAISEKEQDKKERAYIKRIEDTLDKRIKKDFFSFELIEDDDIDFYIICSNRNIGKTYSAKNYLIERCLKENKKFIFLRLTTIEQKNLIDSWKDWFVEKGWKCAKSTGVITHIDSGKVVGYILPLSTIYNYKSNEFDNVDTIIFDEFIGEKRFKNSKKDTDKFTKLVNFIITAERQKKKFKCYLMSNFIDGEDDIIMKLGFGGIEKGDLKVNWILKAMIWTIPSNIFKEFKNKDSMGYKLSLKSKRDYVKNYGGTFVGQNYKNLEKEKFYEERDIVPLFILKQITFCVIFCQRRSDGKIIVDYEVLDIYPYEIPIITTDIEIALKNKDIIYVKASRFENFFRLYYNEDIIVNGDVQTRNDLDRFFIYVQRSCEKESRGLVYEL